MKKNKKNLVLVFALLFGVFATAMVVSNTYAKYTASLGEKTSTATVAKWAFVTDNSGTALTLNLTESKIKANTLDSGKIAPGTEGSFVIALSNATSEVAVDYTIQFDASSLPTNLVLYSDSTFETPLTNNRITGTLNPKAASTNVTVYWKWAYETAEGDSADTTDGTAESLKTVKATITGVQANPVKTN